MLIGSQKAQALSRDLTAMKAACNIVGGAGKIPFIAFDLAGGANLTGSEMLCGQSGNPLNFLSTAGYATLGLPGNMTPGSANAASPTNNFVNSEFGAAWHSDGAILRGMQASTQVGTRANVNGFPIAARSENDTGNNPHNPMYGINRVGADGELLTLIGSQNTDSGGNSMAPAVDDESGRASDQGGSRERRHRPRRHGRARHAVHELRRCDRRARVHDAPVAMPRPTRLPTRIDGDRGRGRAQAGALRLPQVHLSRRPLPFARGAQPGPRSAHRRAGFAAAGITPIFTAAEYNADGEFRKAAAIMKMVINGYAGAGTVTMGGYDYHGQGRNTGETRNFRAGRCIGACLEYAARMDKPLMIYVFSDGSLSANGMVNNTVEGRGKLDWASDNQSTAASFVLVYKPGAADVRRSAAPTRKQIGSMSAMAQRGHHVQPGRRTRSTCWSRPWCSTTWRCTARRATSTAALFPWHGLGGIDAARQPDDHRAVVNGTVTNPV